MVVTEHFAVKIPDGYPLEYAGPVMCAGITMYDPMKQYNVKEGSKVGIVGLGGLGQMGVRLAKVTFIPSLSCSSALVKPNRLSNALLQ